MNIKTSNSFFYTKNTQQGFSLIEIMVSLLIGVVLSVGIIQIFISAKQAYLIQRQSSRIQEDARFALEAIKKQVRQSSYKADSSRLNKFAFPMDSGAGFPNLFDQATQVIFGERDLSNPVRDRIVFRYQGQDDGSIRDCIGRTPRANETVVSMFFIDDGDGDGITSLHCQVNDLPTAGGGNQPLVDGLERMLILYGIDTNQNRSADKYLNATAVAANEWVDVVSVKVSLLFRSEGGDDANNYTVVTTEPQTFTFNGQTETAGDRRIRREFTTTINLRNRTD